MSSRTSKKKSPRSKLSSAPPELPSPALSTVYAAGTSSLPLGERDLQAPAASLSSAAAPDPPSSTVAPSFSSTNEGKHGRKASSNGHRTSKSRWFSRPGSWSRAGGKSAPVTMVAQENVSRENRDPASVPQQQEEPEMAVQLIKEPEDRPVVHPESAGSSMLLQPPTLEPAFESAPNLENVDTDGLKNTTKDVEELEARKADQSTAERPVSSSWFGWWYGQQPASAPPPTEPEPEISKEPTEDPPTAAIIIPSEPSIPSPSGPTPTATPPKNTPPNVPQSLDGYEENLPAARPRSWFSIWGGYQDTNLMPNVDKETAEPPQPNPAVEDSILPEIQASPAENQILPAQVPEAIQQQNETQQQPQTEIQQSIPQASTSAVSRAYAWAFWSKDAKKSEEILGSGNVNTAVGEVAVSNTPSQSNPEPVKVKEVPAVSSSGASIRGPRPSRTIPNLREESRPNTATKADANISTSTLVSVTPKPPTPPPSLSAKQKLQKILPENHILPSFDDCYHRIEQPSLFCQLTKIFKAEPPPSKKHLYIAKEPRRIRKAVAIGVHGFFPIRIVRTVLGEPTGTSIRFANNAASAIKRWAEKNGVEVEVEKIALEGEGKVADRVETLWKLLSNWMEHVKNADFVVIAAHSQGVVVGIQLLARLIEEGCVDKAQIGFTAMAGINLGPFYHLPTSLLTGSAKELFEFQKSESTVSKKYIQALRIVLAHNVRILFVGSIDDQLVPLESSTFSNISHPYIFRAVFVDGRVHAPDFLNHLVGFVMKLRNLGISDHGLVRELSSPLAGSLYGGEGHSRIYDDGAVYDLGIRHALETTECDGVPLKVDAFELPTNTNNPFFLPWSMRGLLEEQYVKTNLENECLQLLRQFEDWKPTSKVLKDVKFRLEGIRSKL